MVYIKSVKELRRLIDNGKNPVEAKPGVYRWWFKKDVTLELLKNFPSLNEMPLLSREINGNVYLGLYFGMSANMRQRIKWHVCQHHSLSSVNSGFLSTLRQTLSALLKVEMSKSEDLVNKFIDINCYWEWEYTQSKTEALQIEKNELSQSPHYYPLNVKNHKRVSNQWLHYLNSLRNTFRK